MPGQFSLKALPKSSFRTINGKAYCLWSYEISWDITTISPSGRLGIVLSDAIDVQDPALYPGEPAVQGTNVLLSLAEGNQIYISALVPPAPAADLVISFIAPFTANATTALMLAEQNSTSEVWSTLPFVAGTVGDARLVQMMDGPANATGLVPATPSLALAKGSSRRVPKATLVSVQFPETDLVREQGAAIEKLNLVHRLNLSKGEVAK